MANKETILIVEDEPALRALVRKVLERFGYEVMDAGSGKAALQVWAKHKDVINLLLTDMVMPDGMSGRELAEQLQADKPQLKVVFTTGYSSELLGEGIALQDGVNFLQKPYHPQKLAQTIRAGLDSV